MLGLNGDALMINHAARGDQDRLVFLPVPWHDRHPDFLALDRQLAPDHPARLVQQILDRLDFRPLLASFYQGRGSASYHPRVYLAVILLEADRKVHSPAQWDRDCDDLLPLRWLLRGARPSRSALYQARHRFRPALVERLNEQVLRQARDRRLLHAATGSLDGTFVAAKGSRHHLLNLQRLDKRLALLDEYARAEQLGQPRPPRPRWLARTALGRLKQGQRLRQARQRLLNKLQRHRRRQADRAKKRRRPDEQVRISVSEAEAAIGRDKLKVLRPLYNVQLVCDLDSDFYLGYGVFAAVTDAGLLPDMLERTKRLCGVLPRELLADSIYASVLDLKACQKHEVVLYAPVPADSSARKQARKRMALPLVGAGGSAGAPPQRGYYGKELFTWDEPSRSYRCPAGQQLHKVSSRRMSRGEDQWVAVEEYGTPACAGCGQRSACTRSKHGRRVKRMVDEPLVEELRRRMSSTEGQQKYKKRKETVERGFADGKEHRGLRQFSSFGIGRAETTVGLLVLLHNGKLLLRPPRPTAQSRPEERDPVRTRDPGG